MQKQFGRWYQTHECHGVSYNCGYCGTLSSPSRHYYTYENQNQPTGYVYICSNCNQPTYISTNKQTPGPIIGREINHLPEIIKDLYEEARKCITVGANTSSVLACRKLLMNVDNYFSRIHFRLKYRDQGGSRSYT